eukprot:GFYU01007575.1.p1 GENE.GFYU01007575.1~~GFYU01007575.1.p1  ORF type:complete len:204 (-),score=41.19 GFYU01007575.1:305-916(-)
MGPEAWHFLPTLEHMVCHMKWTQAPVGGEVFPPHQVDIFERTRDRGSHEIENCIQRTHLSWALSQQCFGKKITDEGKMYAIDVSTQMGYQFTLLSAEIRAPTFDSHECEISVHVKNRGVAPFYYPLRIECWHTNQSKGVVLADDLHTLQPDCSRSYFVTMPFSGLQSMFPLHFHMRSDRIGKNQRIAWANDTLGDGCVEWQLT